MFHPIVQQLVISEERAKGFGQNSQFASEGLAYLWNKF